MSLLLFIVLLDNCIRNIVMGMHGEEVLVNADVWRNKMDQVDSLNLDQKSVKELGILVVLQ